MLDGAYTRLTNVIDYRKLALIPVGFTVLMLIFTLLNGITYGIEFKGGTWISILTDRDFDSSAVDSLVSDLLIAGISDATVTVGYDINTGQNKLTVQTTHVVDDSFAVKDILTAHVGQLTEYDTAKVELSHEPDASLEADLERRLRYGVDMIWEDGILTINSMDLNKEDLDSSLEFYLGEPVDAKVLKKNYNIRTLGPTLGDTFRRQGMLALAVSFLLMSLVVFIAFREVIPALAVIQAAICDIIIALGGMSLLGIPLEPATVAALLMLIGYSVDTDIMLTSRTLKDKRGEFMEKVDDALRTGLTMTGTTLAVLFVIYLISTHLTQIDTWANISAVLILGLLGDIPITWLTNVGIIRWYVESKNAGRSKR